jgi:hypothetical protein
VATAATAIATRSPAEIQTTSSRRIDRVAIAYAAPGFAIIQPTIIRTRTQPIENMGYDPRYAIDCSMHP